MKPVSFDQKFGRRLHQSTRQKPAEVSLLLFHFASSWETSASREDRKLVNIFPFSHFKTWFIQNLNFGLMQFVIEETDIFYFFTRLLNKEQTANTDWYKAISFISFRILGNYTNTSGQTTSVEEFYIARLTKKTARLVLFYVFDASGCQTQTRVCQENNKTALRRHMLPSLITISVQSSVVTDQTKSRV